MIEAPPNDASCIRRLCGGCDSALLGSVAIKIESMAPYYYLFPIDVLHACGLRHTPWTTLRCWRLQVLIQRTFECQSAGVPQSERRQVVSPWPLGGARLVRKMPCEHIDRSARKSNEGAPGRAKRSVLQGKKAGPAWHGASTAPATESPTRKVILGPQNVRAVFWLLVHLMSCPVRSCFRAPSKALKLCMSIFASTFPGSAGP